MSELQQQLQSATVTKRENTGGGFFTDIAVADDVPRVRGPKVLGYETLVTVNGLEHGLGFVLFMEDGQLHLLEGYAIGPENTASLRLETLEFEVHRQPATRVS